MTHYAHQIIAHAKLEAAQKMAEVIRSQMKIVASDPDCTRILVDELKKVDAHIEALTPSGEMWPEKVADWNSDPDITG